MKKKILALVLATGMVFSLASCGSAGSYKLGMGIVVEDGTKEGTAQVDATVATVVTDASGKIVSCIIDVAQTKMKIEGGELQDASEVDLRSKREKGSDYGMVAYGSAKAEWYEQADAFAKAVVGKTGAEVAAIATVINDEGHEVATDDAILAGCTISIAEFKQAVIKACNDEYAKSFSNSDGAKLGLAINTEVDSSSVSASSDGDGAANMYSFIGAVVTDAQGNVVCDLIDSIQPKIAFDGSGKETSYTFNGSKKELKDNYGMVAYAGAIADWYKQAETFENYIVGKNAAGVSGIATTPKDDHHNIATNADPDLLAGCTISITPLQEIVVKAIGNSTVIGK